MSARLIVIWPDDRLTKRDPGIKAAVGAQNVHVRLAIIVLVRLIHIRRGQDNQTRPKIVPLQLYFVSLEERLLRNGGSELGNIEDFDGSRLALRIKR
jgi:hypothetical protein